MNPTRSPLILRAVVILFAVSMMTGYVVFSQSRVQPRVQKGTRSGPVIENLPTDAAPIDQAPAQTVQVQKLTNGVVPALPAGITMPGSKTGRIFSGSTIIGDGSQNGEEEIVELPNNTAILSTKSGAPLVSPQAIQIRPNWLTPTPAGSGQTQGTIQMEQPGRLSAPGSKTLVPLIPQDAIQFAPANPATQQTAPVFAPGSKSRVPLIKVEPATKDAGKPEARR